MFIELVDALRCPAGHAESHLVAAIDELVDRDVVSGMLGCPVCRSEFAVRDGELWMVSNEIPAVAVRPTDPDSDALRLAASLDLRSEKGFAILRGPWCSLAGKIAEISPTHLVLLDPPANTRVSAGTSVVHGGGVVPFGAGTAVAAATDDADHAFALANTVSSGGRVVGPIGVPVPPSVKELLRDERWWVGEKENASSPVSIGRRSATQR
jgi:hypothetical protein